MPYPSRMQRKRFTLHIISTTSRANYTIRSVGAPPARSVSTPTVPWIHTQTKIDLLLDTSLNVVKWKYVWQLNVPTIDDRGEEIPYTLRTWPKGKYIPPMPIGLAVMLWLERVSPSLETELDAGRRTLKELGLRGGEHLVIAPSPVVGK